MLGESMLAVQQLVALATDHPVNLTGCTARLRVPKENGGWELRSADLFFRARLFRTRETTRDPHAREFLFRRDELGELGDALFRWEETRRDLDSMFGLVFSERYGEGMLLDQRFSYLIQALETYHRRRRGGEAIPARDHAARMDAILDHTPEEHRTWLKRKLQYSNEPSLRRRLREVVGMFPQLVEDLVPREGKFIQKVLDTRNYFTHHDRRLKARRAVDEELYLVTEVLRSFCTGLLLKELGFDPAECATRLRRRRGHQWLSGKARHVF